MPLQDVKVEPMNPHNFWSAGEDGMVRQFDTRCRCGTAAVGSSRAQALKSPDQGWRSWSRIDPSFVALGLFVQLADDARCCQRPGLRQQRRWAGGAQGTGHQQGKVQRVAPSMSPLS